jgi:hypothetical protein
MSVFRELCLAMATLAMAIFPVAAARAEPCGPTAKCAQQAVDAADRAETAVKALMDRINQQQQQIGNLTTALKAFQKPRVVPQPNQSCTHGGGQIGCVARCDPDEIAIGGECFVEAGGGALQNAGMGDDNSYACTFNGSSVAHATAWCVKRPH